MKKLLLAIILSILLAGPVSAGTLYINGVETTVGANVDNPDIDGGTINNTLQSNVKFDHNVETLSANKTLTITNKIIQKLDPDGTDRNILLPTEATSTDLVFFIYNMGGEVGEDLYIQDDAGAALKTVYYECLAICTCDGSTWTVTCVACVSGFDILNLRAKEENTSALVIGQPVYISGATGVAFPNAGLADCDDSSKIRIKGLVAEAISQNSTGYIRVKGLLENVDSTKGGLINPNSEDWTAGDQLWVARTVGGLTNVRPSSGRTIKAGTALTVEGANSKILVDVRENPVFASAASGEDLVLRVGDSAGANKVSYRDYADNEVASIDSDGKQIVKQLQVYSTDTHGGYITKIYEATSGTLAGATDKIELNIPSGWRILQCQLHVKTAVVDDGGNDTWSSELNDGAQEEVISAGSAAAQNTNVSHWAIAETWGTLTDAETDILLTPQGGNFTAGEIEAHCLCQGFDAWDNE